MTTTISNDDAAIEFWCNVDEVWSEKHEKYVPGYEQGDYGYTFYLPNKGVDHTLYSTDVVGSAKEIAAALAELMDEREAVFPCDSMIHFDEDGMINYEDDFYDPEDLIVILSLFTDLGWV